MGTGMMNEGWKKYRCDLDFNAYCGWMSSNARHRDRLRPYAGSRKSKLDTATSHSAPNPHTPAEHARMALLSTLLAFSRHLIALLAKNNRDRMSSLRISKLHFISLVAHE